MADEKDVDSTKSNPADVDPAAESSDAVEVHGSSPLGDRDLAGEDEGVVVDPPEELLEDDEQTDEPDTDGDSESELVSAGAPTRRAARAKASDSDDAQSGPGKKGRPTPKQNQVAEAEPRTGPVKFVRESVGELRKVVYPTGQQLAQYFVVVLIFVLFIIAVVSVLDLAFGWAIFKIFS